MLSVFKFHYTLCFGNQFKCRLQLQPSWQLLLLLVDMMQLNQRRGTAMLCSNWSDTNQNCQ